MIKSNKTLNILNNDVIITYDSLASEIDHLISYDEFIPILNIINDKFKDNPFLVRGRSLSGSINDILLSRYIKRSSSKKLQMINNLSHRHYYKNNILIGSLSCLTYGEEKYDVLKVENSNEYFYEVEYDILFLGVLKKPFRYKNNTNSTKINKKDIVILINKDLFWQNDSYFKRNFMILSDRLKIKKRIKEIISSEEIEFKIVSNDYLNNFKNKGKVLKTHSLLKIKEIEENIKSSFYQEFLNKTSNESEKHELKKVSEDVDDFFQ